MFTFLNTLEVIPPAQQDFIFQILRDQEIAVPVMLKATAGKPGHISLIAWIPRQEPISQAIATEWVVCAGNRPQLSRVIQEFAGLVRQLSVGLVVNQRPM